MEREQLRKRLDEKRAKVDALCEERTALMEQMARVRHSMSMQVSMWLLVGLSMVCGRCCHRHGGQRVRDA